MKLSQAEFPSPVRLPGTITTIVDVARHGVDLTVVTVMGVPMVQLGDDLYPLVQMRSIRPADPVVTEAPKMKPQTRTA